MKKLQEKLLNADGSINGKILAGLISLIIVLVQQVLALTGIKFTGDIGSIINVINTVLLILGTLGVLEQPTLIDGGNTDEKTNN